MQCNLASIGKISLFFIHLSSLLAYSNHHADYGPDRLELIIFDFTGKKIDNRCSRLVIEFFLYSVSCYCQRVHVCALLPLLIAKR